MKNTKKEIEKQNTEHTTDGDLEERLMARMNEKIESLLSKLEQKKHAETKQIDSQQTMDNHQMEHDNQSTEHHESENERKRILKFK